MPIYKSLVRKVSIPAQNKIKQKDYLPKGTYPVIDQGHELIGGYTDDPSKLVRCRLPVIVFGDHTKAVKYITFPFAAGADGIKVLEVAEGIDPRFLFYATKYLTYKIENKGYARHYQFVEKKGVSIPELPEQQRIVARIEELFSQLDDAEATLQKTKAQLALYRQAVLKDAFAFDSPKAPIRDISSIVTSGSRGWAKYYSDQGARFIRITDLTRDRIQLKSDDIQRVYLPDTIEGKRSRLKPNDVLVSITADLGSIAIIPDGIEEAYINQHIAMIRFTDQKQGLFMAWYLKSDYGQKDLLKNKRGNGKLGLGLDDIRKTQVPVVNDEFANKVVDAIDSRLSIWDYIEQRIELVLSECKSMRQVILKRTIDGER